MWAIGVWCPKSETHEVGEFSDKSKHNFLDFLFGLFDNKN